ncbi:fungal-specific transcription factor domain-containing protein [Chaetomium sp. MPI-CAGE-AT-0009]|nr:fungal-specific transcription factor domain-containing protein [Chaetomium sp. MPI-CAGE-AT-0009]
MPMDHRAAPEPNRMTGKSQRVLACQLCQQRKVKCDRKFPCANCTRAGTTCVPAALVPRQRRRRFPERELLARIRHYETLLRQHNVAFDPLHPPTTTSATTETADDLSPLDTTTPDTPRTTQSDVTSQEKATKTKATNLWHALSQNNPEQEGGSDNDLDGDDRFLRDDDDMGDVIKNVWDRTYNNASESSHHLLFGSPVSTIALTTLHPDQGKIFRLWQIYLDNVNPLLKVTHTPSLQGRIIDAISDLSSISPPLEALLFSIYCTATLSLAEDQCQTLFGSPRKDLLAGYQFACQQALLNSKLLQSSDHDCLTAFFLYLVSLKPGVDPRSLSSMLAVAIHMAQRMGYHKESSNESRPVLEGEMRRRLWWALVIFNSRICETYNYRTGILGPTWNCRTPLNLNDFELLLDMRTAPTVHDKPTEALFVLVRSQLSDFIRHCAFHLDFTDPYLATFTEGKSTAQHELKEGSDPLLRMHETVERTLRPCDPNIPLHFITIWTARAFVARSRLLAYCARRAAPAAAHTSQPPHPGPPTASQPTPPTQQQQPPSPRAGLPQPTSTPSQDGEKRQKRQEEEEEENDGLLPHALAMLRCDTRLMTSPLTRSFRWHVASHFPFLAYIALAGAVVAAAGSSSGSSKGGRGGVEAEWEVEVWEAMSENYEARGMDGDSVEGGYEAVFGLFAGVVLRAWEAVVKRGGGPGGGEREVPRIVRDIQGKMALVRAEGRLSGGGGGGGGGGRGDVQSGMEGGSVAGMMPSMDAGDGVGGQAFMGAGDGSYVMDMISGQGGLGYMEVDPLWSTADWGLM